MVYKKIFLSFIARFKKLRGDPDYIGRGMAIGVLIGVTPTFPFHTALALALATLLRGSRPAAILGVYVGNPLTMPLLYVASYKVGMLLLGKSFPAFSLQQQSLPELLKLGIDIAAAMVAGGFVIGIVPCIAAYFITRKMVSAFHAYKKTVRPHAPSQETPHGQKHHGLSRKDALPPVSRQAWMTDELEAELRLVAHDGLLTCEQVQAFAAKHAIAITDMKLFVDRIGMKVSNCRGLCA